MRMLRQLGREDWIEAGLRLLCETGPAALRVEPTAKRLGVSKGSFYWHFRDRAAWRDALLAYWDHLVFAEMTRGSRDRSRASAPTPPPAQGQGTIPLAGAGHCQTPRSRSDCMGRNVPQHGFDMARLEAALEVWALDDAWVARALLRVQAERQRRQTSAPATGAIAA
jgi:AcrR family transcriptional regulator